MSPTRRAPADDDPLTRAWAQLSTLFTAKRDDFFAAIRRHGLTPPHGFALTSIVDAPMRMRELAAHMSCDASYITAIVDRLEGLGFAERRADADDRRVKVIAPTPLGRDIADELRSILAAPPPAFEQLSPTDRRALARILAKIVPDLDTATDPTAAPRTRPHR